MGVGMKREEDEMSVGFSVKEEDEDEDGDEVEAKHEQDSRWDGMEMEIDMDMIPSLLHTPNIPLHNHIYTLSLSLTFTSSSFLQLYCPFLRAWAVVFRYFFRSFIATVLTCQLSVDFIQSTYTIPDTGFLTFTHDFSIYDSYMFILHSPSLASFFSFSSVLFLSFTFDVTSFS